MSEKTGISWTDATWNPVRGCSKVSPGCAHCYAERVAVRFSGPGQPYEGLADRERGRWTGAVRMVHEHLADPLRWRRPRRIFVNSMSDLFHEGLSNEEIAAVFGVMAAAPRHTFQVLTKRARRMRDALNDTNFRRLVEMFAQVAAADRIEEYFAPERVLGLEQWPGYAITSKGRVISNRRGPDRDMKFEFGEQGHARVMLYRDGVGQRVLVHRLVLEAFDRAPKDGEQGCHITGDAKNNALWNLRWGSQADNWRDRKRHGNRRSYTKLTTEQVRDIRARCGAGESAYAVAKDFGISDTQARNIVASRQWSPEDGSEWPLGCVWLGVSVENQAAADERIPELLGTPAAVRFLSCEPLLGPVDVALAAINERCAECGERVRGYNNGCVGMYSCGCTTEGAEDGDLIKMPDWVIAGCESGPGARPCEVDWLRSLRDQCEAANVPFFLKQAVGQPRDANQRITAQGLVPIIDGGPGSKNKPGGVIELPYLDGVQHAAFPEVTDV